MIETNRNSRTGWCILRMAGQRTLAVVSSLSQAGIGVWTPSTMRRKFRPRSTKYTDFRIPLLPSFAFADADQVRELLAIVHAPISAHPPFSIFTRGDEVQLVRDRDLEALREYERLAQEEWERFVAAAARDAKRKRKKSRAKAYVLGQRVRVDRPAFSGLEGKIVEIRNNGDLVLEFHGFLRGAAVPACDVEPIQLSTQSNERAPVA